MKNDLVDRFSSVDDEISGKSIHPGLILVSILTLSAVLNLMNIQFGLPYVYGRNVEGRIVAIAVNAFVTGDLNPHVAIYPHLQLYLLLPVFILYYLWGLITGTMTSRTDLLTVFQTDPTALYTISRGVTALFGTGCVLLVYLIVKRLYGRKAALISSFLTSTFPLMVSNSHLVTPDVIMTFFILTSFFYSIKIMERGRSLDYFLSGAMLGLGCTAKYPAAIAAVIILCAHLLHKRSDRRSGGGNNSWGRFALIVTMFSGAAALAAGIVLDFSLFTSPFDRYLPGNSYKIALWIQIVVISVGIILLLFPYLTRKIRMLSKFTFDHYRLLAAIGGCVLFIIMGSPYLLIDFSITLNALIYHALTESNPFWGSEETPAGWIYYLDLLMDGTSKLFVVSFLAGTALLLYRHRKKDILILSFPIVYYLFIGSFEVKVPRYIIPIIPFLAIFSGSIIDTVTTSRREVTPYLARKILVVALSLIAIPSLISAVQWDLKMGKTDSRTEANEWIDNHIPAGSKIAIDALGPPISQSNFQLYVFYMGSLQSFEGLDPWGHYWLGKAKDTNILLKEGIDYVVVNSNAYGNYNRVPHLYPEEHAFYQDLDSLGTLIKEFHPEENPGPAILIFSLAQRPDSQVPEGTIPDRER